MSQLLKLTAKQKILRQEWLALTVLKFIAMPLVLLTLKYSAVLQSSPSLTYMIGRLVGFGVGFSLAFYLIYFCAYKKPGTRYLTLCMIVGAANVFSTIADGLSRFSSIFEISVLIAYLAIEVAWFLLSLKMRKLNRNIKFLSNPGVISPVEKL